MNKLVYFLAVLLLAFGLTNCATLFTGTSDDITVNSEPEGAQVVIDGIEQGRTPATISVKRPGFGEKQVVLKLDGYEDRVFKLQKEFNAISVLNLGSILGWGIDIATGAVTKYNPKNYNMELEEVKTTYLVKDLPRDSQGNYKVPPTDEDLVITDKESGLQLLFENKQ